MNKTVSKWLSLILSTLIGGGFGFSLAYFLVNSQISPLQLLIHLAFVPVLFLLHIIIHEAGHGLFGYATGYQMVSYRVLSYLWVWQDQGIVFKRQKVPGTLGQCLMRPPAYNQGHYPFKLFLLGGVLANLGTSILAVLIFQFNSFSVLFGLIGLFLCVTNIIPAGFNDGMSLKLAWSDELMQYLLYLQFEVNYQLTIGNTYQNLPPDTFNPLPKKADSYFVTFHTLVRCGYQLEQLDIQGARNLLEELWPVIDDIIPIYQVEIKKELLFCLTILDPTDERISAFTENKLVKASLKQPVMGNKRVLASYAYFIENDWQTGAKLTQEGLELHTKTPTLGEAKIELKLIEWLDEQAIIYHNRRGASF